MDVQLANESGLENVSAYRDSEGIRIVSVSEVVDGDAIEGRLWRAVTDGNPRRIETAIKLTGLW